MEISLKLLSRFRGPLLSAVRLLLEQHISGRRNHHFRLWNLLMLELWYRTFIDTQNRGWLNASRFPNLTTSEIGR